MSERVTISFVGTQEIKGLLEKWAVEGDRSVSYILRQVLEKEARAAPPKRKKNKRTATTKSETRRR